MEYPKEVQDAVDALNVAIPAIESLQKIDFEGALTSSLSPSQKLEVNKLKNSSPIIKEAKEMAKKFNVSKFNL